MYGNRKIHLRILIFIIISPSSWASPYDLLRHDKVYYQRFVRSPSHYRNKQCSKEDDRCFHSAQCCSGLVCLRAGNSDGYCIRQTSLQPCKKTPECPPGCGCEIMGLQIDGINGVCVAWIKLDSLSLADDIGHVAPASNTRLRTAPSPARAFHRSVVGGLVREINPDSTPNKPAKPAGRNSKGPTETNSSESSLESVYGDEIGQEKVNELSSMIEKLESVAGGEPLVADDEYELKERSMPGSTNNQKKGKHTNHDNIETELPPYLANILGQYARAENGSVSETTRKLYETICRFLKSTETSGKNISVATRAVLAYSEPRRLQHARLPMLRNGRLGHPCQRSGDCYEGSNNYNSLARWQVCCAEVRMMRQGVKRVCERMIPITTCID